MTDDEIEMGKREPETEYVREGLWRFDPEPDDEGRYSVNDAPQLAQWSDL